MAVTGGEKRDPEPAANTPESPPNPDQTAEPSSPEPSEEHANPEVTTPEQEARRESEERIRGLLEAYQETLDTVEDLPAVVWVPWDRKGPGRYFKVPYLRLFLKYFVEYHIGRSLDTLNRRFYATAALSSDPDANWSKREAVKLYLQSLPRPPYRILIFAAVLAALVIALPLQAFGNVFYVLDLVGAMMRFNVSYVDRAFEGKEIGPTVRSLAVLLVGLIVVGALLTSPFGLKRILFNLHPWTKERLDSTAARSHGFRVEGLYALEDSIFEEAGIRHPKEGRWDLAFQTFLLSLLLVFGLCLAGLSLVIFMSWDINLNVDAGGSANVHLTLPKVSWAYYALFTGLVFAAFVLLLRRLLTAWKKRSRNAIG
ncbi:MAG: hypothetical protein M3Q62_14920 [Actinomycetota bacterium]|jgi:hypothetical protein|nr:hypothetical protein [Rubrobacteraceae bacterium]MDQ3184789.1 hypothetical protein [Actinomycetota bacterium]MDQ3496429.1 hypothetical protein [Actinomycetota bacterium]